LAGLFFISIVAGYGALTVVPLLGVDAVVVDPVGALHPLHLSKLRLAQLASPGVRGGGRQAAGGAATIVVALADVIVVGDEGCLGPVRLDTATLCRPFLRRPDARVGEHRPLCWERLVVAEHAVNIPPANFILHPWIN
jgi:hypothetical protein